VTPGKLVGAVFRLTGGAGEAGAALTLLRAAKGASVS
jgi:hypothetical protein